MRRKQDDEGEQEVVAHRAQRLVQLARRARVGELHVRGHHRAYLRLDLVAHGGEGLVEAHVFRRLEVHAHRAVSVDAAQLLWSHGLFDVRKLPDGLHA
jgi:hypothetical protein